MEKLLKEKSVLSLNTYPDAIEILYKNKIFLIKNVDKVEEKLNPHITSFTSIVNGKSSSFIINCGHTPPTIKFLFPNNEKLLFIDHTFQDKILEELNKLIGVCSYH